MWRTTVVMPEHGPVVYARLIFVPEPFVMPAREPRRTTRPAAGPSLRFKPAAPAASATTTTTENVAPTPATADDAVPAPVLDLAAMRASAGEHERQRARSGVELVQEDQRVRGRDDSDAARAIKKAGRADCTKAYAGGGFDPLKLIPLIYDTLTDTGCRW